MIIMAWHEVPEYVKILIVTNDKNFIRNVCDSVSLSIWFEYCLFNELIFDFKYVGTDEAFLGRDRTAINYCILGLSEKIVNYSWIRL